jgi:hypothetical protein
MKFKAGDVLVHNSGDYKVQVLKVWYDCYDLKIIAAFSKKNIKCIGNERLMDAWIAEELYYQEVEQWQ